MFNRYFSVSDFDDVVTRFKSGISVEVGDMMPSGNYERIVKQVEGLDEHSRQGGAEASAPQTASVVEFILEGLHLNKRLNKDKVGAQGPVQGLTPPCPGQGYSHGSSDIATPSGTARRKSRPSIRTISSMPSPMT